MKSQLFLIIIFCKLTVNAQNYQISFAGTGESTTVNTVKVENLTEGTSLILNGSDILSLTWTVGIPLIENKRSPKIRFSPNPMTDNSILQIYPPSSGNVTITVFDLTGKQVVQIQSYLENCLQEYRLTGIKIGYYLVSVKGSTWQYSGKLLSNGISNGTASIKKVSNSIQVVDEKLSTKDYKGAQTTVDMNYYPGDRLKFTGISGIYNTVITDIPISDKTITFNFITCTDGDNNNYPVVYIGTQIWMAENLKTTKFNNGSDIPNITVESDWSSLSTPGYCWYDNDAVVNKNKYGALYNRYAVTDLRNLCPTGWHSPSENEWSKLVGFLGGQSLAGGELKETGNIHWLSPNSGATNETGFTALPGGIRGVFGTFMDVSIYGYWWNGFDSYKWGQGLSHYSSSIFPLFSNDDNFGYSVRCLKGDMLLAETNDATTVSSTSVTLNGRVNPYRDWTTITFEYGTTTSYGQIITTSYSPPLVLAYLTGLAPGTTYHCRIKADYSGGTNFGNDLTFVTPGIVTDIDGNIYNIIQIGTQAWLKENLKTTKYNDGTDIPNVTDAATWAALTTDAYFNYDPTYGNLYNGYAVVSTNTKNVCPADWHVPSDDEWTTLENYLIDNKYNFDGTVTGNKYAISLAYSSSWMLSFNAGAIGSANCLACSNKSGFTALPEGIRYFQGMYDYNGRYGYWWSSSSFSFRSLWVRAMYFYASYVDKITYVKEYGLSIRCLKNH